MSAASSDTGKGKAMTEPCGSYRVIEWDRGNPAVVKWCERTSGACPFPGADKAPNARHCAVEVQGEPS